MSQNIKAIASKNCKKPKHKLASPRDKEVHVITSEKDKPSMGRELRVHHILPKCSAEKMQNPLNFCCWDVTYSSGLGQNPGISSQWHWQLCGLSGDEFWLDRQHPYSTSLQLTSTTSVEQMWECCTSTRVRSGKPSEKDIRWQKHEWISAIILAVNL